MPASAAAVMAASIRLVGSLLSTERGEGPEEGTESRIWSVIVGLIMCRPETVMHTRTDVVIDIDE